MIKALILLTWKVIINPDVLLLILLIIGILVLLIILKFPYLYPVKITSFFFTWVKALIYFSFYIIFFFFLRYARLQNGLDLIGFFAKIQLLLSTFISSTLYWKIFQIFCIIFIKLIITFKIIYFLFSS